MSRFSRRVVRVSRWLQKNLIAIGEEKSRKDDRGQLGSCLTHLGRQVPIGPLIREHCIIQAMVKIISGEAAKTSGSRLADPCFVDVVVDFFRTYADRCHHGKEEDILFRELSKKQLSEEHKRTMDELVEEHVYARKTVRRLLEARKRFVEGKTEADLKDVEAIVRELVKFYPLHIEKEDKRFFYPVMEYFTQRELDSMLDEFWEFDRKMIHEKYETLLRSLQGKGA